MEIRQEVGDKSTPRSKKIKLSSSLIGSLEVTKKNKKKFRGNKSPQKKQRNHQFATTVEVVNKFKGLGVLELNPVPAAANFSSTQTSGVNKTSTRKSAPYYSQKTKKKQNKNKKGKKKRAQLCNSSRSLGAPAVGDGVVQGRNTVQTAAIHIYTNTVPANPFKTNSDFTPIAAMTPEFAHCGGNFSTPFPPPQHPLPNMSEDRPMHRDTSSWSNSADDFVDDSLSTYSGQDGGLFINFSNDWPDLRGAASFLGRNPSSSNSRYRWQKEQSNWQPEGSRHWFGSNDDPQKRFQNDGSQERFQNDGSQERFQNDGSRERFQNNGSHRRFQNDNVYSGWVGNHHGWNSWGPDNLGIQQDNIFLRPQSAGNENQTRQMPWQRSHWDHDMDQSAPERSEGSNQWQNLTKQFGNSHFHREFTDSFDKRLSDISHGGPADSSGLGDSGSSGGGKKRPRSLDRGDQYSQSSGAKNPTSYEFYGFSRYRYSPVSDQSRAEFQKPDSTSKKIKAPKPKTVAGQGSVSASGSDTSTGGLGRKKKQTGIKLKKATFSASGTMTSAVAGEVDGGASEGVLERAERLCKELREKRKQVVPSQASLNAQRVGHLRSMLNTAVNSSRFNLAHKSFLRGYISDSNSTAKRSDADNSQEKDVSATVTSETEQPARFEGSLFSNVDNGAEMVASSTRSSHACSDIDRIRHSIESSVVAEGRAHRTSAGERSFSGGQPPTATVLPSGSNLLATSSVTVSAISLANKPPLPLSKDALAKMINAPRSRTQRLQLARIFRQHSEATAVQPRRIQLDGLYDNDGDSFEDVLKNISGLEEIGECAELRKIKLEDLTCEDKLRIAQMIEEADSGSRHHTDSTDFGEETSVPLRCHQLPSARVTSSDVMIQDKEPSTRISCSRSPLRSRTASPSPSRPLSLDDLNTEDRTMWESSTDSVSFPSRPVDASTSSSTVTALHSGSPARSTDPGSPACARSTGPLHSVSLKPSLTHGVSPKKSLEETGDSSNNPSLTPMRSPPRRLVEGVGKGGNVPRMGEAADLASFLSERTAASDRLSGRSAPNLMDASESAISSSPTWHQPSLKTGVLHEVIGLCQRQDTILSDMRAIDNELCAMYKSLIEIVARMSGLQRRRVQFQAESEELSRRRHDLLNGLYPRAAVPWDRGPLSAAVGSEHPLPPSTSATTDNPAIPSENDQHSSKNAEIGEQQQLASGPSIILPSWLTTASSSCASRPAEAEKSVSRQETGLSSSSDHRAEVCLSGSVMSPVGSAASHAMSQASSLCNSVGTMREMAPHQTSFLNVRSSSSSTGERAGQVKLSISAAVDSSASRNVTSSSMSCFSTETSHLAEKSNMGADNSSGISSSVSIHRTGMGSPMSDSGTIHNVSTQSCQEEQNQPVKRTEPSRLVIHSFTSPNPSKLTNGQSPGVSQPRSPGVSVAYLGALSSDLVQQIVRNLPMTSQLGEVHKPAMYMVRQGTTTMDISSDHHQSQSARSRSASVEDPAIPSRTRTTSLHSISSDLSSGEQAVTDGVPPLKLHNDSDRDRAGSKTTTPRSESDAHSITSGTSLGEQIKLFSERNSSQQDTPTSESFADTQQREKDDTKYTNMCDCSVVLERLDMDKITIIPDLWRGEDEADRRKKRKSRKDRDQSLQHRHRYFSESSSEGDEGDRTLISDVGSYLRRSSRQQHLSFDGVKMEADCGAEEELDRTVVGQTGDDHPSEEEQHGELVDSSQAAASSSTGCPVNPSRLKLRPENLNVFRANILRNLKSPATSSESNSTTMETAGTAAKEQSANEIPAVTNKETMVKISGPSAPVTGLCVHNQLLYACFQRIGINSYTMKGELSMEYLQPDAQCFALVPVGSGSQHHLAMGLSIGLIFLSINDPQTMVNHLNTEVKVTCMQVVDALLFVGLDSGEVIVVSLTTLEVIRRFQASDCTVQCMAWTREGSTRLLAVASLDANIHVIDAGSGLPIRIISGHTKTAFSLFMCDHIVISGSGDRKVMAHNVHNAAFLWELQDHRGIITSVCVDNGLLFTAGYDKIIRCYDLKSRKLLHLMYGAGRCVIMKMAICNSVLYTGNRDGEIEAIDLRDMGSYACECLSCCAVYGLKEHLWHHLMTDHLLPNSQAMRCPWSHCSDMLDTHSASVKAAEHMRRHIDGSL